MFIIEITEYIHVNDLKTLSSSLTYSTVLVS